jgi:hypothetical protein
VLQSHAPFKGTSCSMFFIFQQYLSCLLISSISTILFLFLIWSFSNFWNLSHSYENFKRQTCQFIIPCIKNLFIFITQDGIYNQHNTYFFILWIVIMVVSLTWLIVFFDIPIVCMIKINILQKLFESPIPCDHSPSIHRLMHPLLFYTISRMVLLSYQIFLTK